MVDDFFVALHDGFLAVLGLHDGVGRPRFVDDGFEDYIRYFLTLYPAVANFGTLADRVLMLS